MENKNNPYALLSKEAKKSKKLLFIKILNKVKNLFKGLDSRFTLSDSDFAQIEPFQLLNVLENQIPCEVYFLTGAPSSDKRENFIKFFKNQPFLVKNTSKFNFEHLLKKIKELQPEDLKQISPSHPVILISEDPEVSKKWALTLVKKWKNVFYLKGGLTTALED